MQTLRRCFLAFLLLALIGCDVPVNSPGNVGSSLGALSAGVVINADAGAPTEPAEVELADGTKVKGSIVVVQIQKDEGFQSGNPPEPTTESQKELESE